MPEAKFIAIAVLLVLFATAAFSYLTPPEASGMITAAEQKISCDDCQNAFCQENDDYCAENPSCQKEENCAP
ncbi:MAG: hypothetical protein ACE5DI_01980 [Candidatus Micrarchaeia archaeon]